MMKKMTRKNHQVLISNGSSCSIIAENEDKSRNFETEGLSCLSSDGSLIAINEMKGIRVRRVISTGYEWRIGDVLFTCQNLPPEQVLNFAWSPLGEILAVQLADGAIYTYQVTPGRGLASRPGEQKAVYHLDSPLERPQAMIFAPNMKRIALAQTMGGVVLWEANSGEPFRNLESPSVLSLVWSPDERFFALGCIDSSVMVFIPRTGRFIHLWKGEHTAGVSALAWSPDGQTLTSGDRDGNILQWKTSGDQSTWGPIGHIKPTMNGEIEALAWSLDSEKKEIAVVDSLDTLDFFSLR